MIKSQGLKKALIILLIICAVFSSGCDNSQCLETVPFTLKTSIRYNDIKQNEIMLIKNTEEFENYLGNTTIFKEELSEEFKAVNAQYTEEFFENNYLVAIIKYGSYSTTGYKLISIEKEDSILYIDLEAILPNIRYENAAFGDKFTYYITVEKDETLTEAKLKY